MSTTMTLTQYTSTTTANCDRNTYYGEFNFEEMCRRAGSFLFAVAKKINAIAYEVFITLSDTFDTYFDNFAGLLASFITRPVAILNFQAIYRTVQAFFPPLGRAGYTIAPNTPYYANRGDIIVDDEFIPEFDDVPFENVREELKQEGAEFIAKCIFNNITPTMKDLLETSDERIYTYAITKALFIYTLGSKCKEPVPEFFKDATMASISQLRTELSKELATNTELLEAIDDIDKYEKCLAEHTAAANALKRLSEASYEESKGGLFLNECCLRALKRIGQFSCEAEMFHH